MLFAVVRIRDEYMNRQSATFLNFDLEDDQIVTDRGKHRPPGTLAKAVQ